MYSNGRSILSLPVLDQVNEQALESTMARYDRNTRRCTKLLNVSLPAMMISLSVSIVFAIGLALVLILAKLGYIESERVVLVAQVLGIIVSVFALTWAGTILSERVLQRTTRKRYEDLEQARDDGLAWRTLDLENVPARILVAPVGLPGRELLWSYVDGLDRDTVRMLAKESNMSLGQVRQAVRQLA